MSKQIYAGIGARRTPKDIQQMMQKIGEIQALIGYKLHSGGAKGADSQFEAGHRKVNSDNLEIFLPWDGFNKRYLTDSANTIGVSKKASQIALRYHPAWGHLSNQSKKLMARNAYQLLGPNLDAPVNLIICWTPDAKIVGGTGQALRMAGDLKIPVANLANQEIHGLYMRLINNYTKTTLV
jgi:hypothetical protein